MIYGNVLEELRLRTEENQKQIKIKDDKETQKELADLIKVEKSVYGKYERENEIMPLKHLNTICNYYNVSFDYIFGFTKDKQYLNNNKITELDQKLVGKNLKNIRKELKKSQKQIGDCANFSYGTIAGYEKGRYLVSTKLLYYICKKYNISADYLLGKINEPKYLNSAKKTIKN